MRGKLRLVVGSRFAGSATHMLLVFSLLLGTLPAALMWRPVAFICATALALAIMGLIFGLRRTACGLLFLGFGTVSFNNVRPVGSLSWMELSDPFFIAGFLLLIPGFARTVLRLPTTFLVGATGLLAIGSLSAVATDQPGPNFAHLLDITQGMVLLPVLLAWWQPGIRAVATAAAAYMFGTSVNVVAALLEGPDLGDRYGGLSVHPNIMGYCLVLSLALAPFLLETMPRRYRWTVAVMSVISMYGVWISGSRAALLGAVVLTLLFPVLKRSIPAALGVAGLFLPALVLVDRVAQKLDPSSALGRLLGADSTASNEARLAGARAGIDQFLDHPLLGDGWLTVWGAHNGYLQVAAAIGVFGFVSYIVLLTSVLRPLIAVPRPYGLLAVPGLAMVMLDLALPVLGARYVWCVVGLAFCAPRLAAMAGSDSPSEPLDEARDRNGITTPWRNPDGSRQLTSDTDPTGPYQPGARALPQHSALPSGGRAWSGVSPTRKIRGL